MSDEKDQIYLDHILECISLIQTYTQNGRASFWASAMMQDAVLRRLQTMSESTQDFLKYQMHKLRGWIGEHWRGFGMFWFMTIWGELT